ncbi:IPP transferase-domain-containing protein [Blastocladiella britannica]|nr:IPP transferase-domain-containing protein [Blastocladiella britannica]
MPTPPPPPPPLIAVVGTTGSGKSDLSLALARALDAHVINSDALQVYAPLSVITNKVPASDRAAVPHHLIDTRALGDPDYGVREFTRDASRLISSLWAGTDTLPETPAVIVGGTHYYLQYLLWGDENGGDGAGAEVDDGEGGESAVPPATRALTDPAQLHAALAAVDPAVAARWHPNDTRRVRRAIERHYARRAADTPDSDPAPSVTDANADPAVVTAAASLRYPALVFWTYSAPAVLDARLDARVDAMVASGLFRELWQLRAAARAVLGTETADAHETLARGIFQAIGYKEFAGYICAVEALAADLGVDLSDVDLDGADAAEDPDPVVVHLASVAGAAPTSVIDDVPSRLEEIANLRATALIAMKTATRRYAKRQIHWLRSRLAPRITASQTDTRAGAMPGAIYALDTSDLSASDPSAFADRIVARAVPIARDWIARRGVASPEGWPAPGSVDPVANTVIGDGPVGLGGPTDWRIYQCEVCNKTIRGDKDWAAHSISRGHRTAKKRQRKAEMRQAMQLGETTTHSDDDDNDKGSH